ncbi:uncharacterized protein A4U43_C05F7750 [Asparagus officinalis]|uniref:Protein kinase domain-containing protein n=1 Tax=Asparagus officinalis TaxID=4686 RepID=A0A5P1ETS7_ASPOF|nr:uncharacterized protein A4U43_C05F7750 [Asparagus officinalis]
MQSTNEADFFTEYGEASRYQIHEVVDKGSYGVVGVAVDTHNGEKLAIKKINDVFEHVSDATRILIMWQHDGTVLLNYVALFSPR